MKLISCTVRPENERKTTSLDPILKGKVRLPCLALRSLQTEPASNVNAHLIYDLNRFKNMEIGLFIWTVLENSFRGLKVKKSIPKRRSSLLQTAV